MIAHNEAFILLQALPEGQDYAVQHQSGHNGWTYLGYDLIDYFLTRDAAYKLFLNTNSTVRLVRISRYLPDGTTDPVVLEVIKFKVSK